MIMKNLKKKAIVAMPWFQFALAGLFFVQTASANVSGLDFSEEEIASSLRNAKTISEVAASCLDRTYEAHLRFYEKRGYSKFYGNRNPKHKNEESRAKVLLSILSNLKKRVDAGDPKAIAELKSRLKELEATSCIGLAMACLSEGFSTVGMQPTWDKIYSWLGRIGNDGAPMFYGTDLQKALIDLGWKSLYWNPDLSQNAAWDRNEKMINPLPAGQVWNPVWGGHEYRWAIIKKSQSYYEIPVHDIQTLVNFGVRPPSEFKKVPFFLGIAHAGYHVFPGMNGKVVEAHSMRELKSKENLEVGEFNPLNQIKNGQKNGNGAPKWTAIEHYRSGIIVVPPGYISDKTFIAPGPARGAPTFMPHKPHPGHNDHENEMWGDPNRWRAPWQW